VRLASSARRVDSLGLRRPKCCVHSRGEFWFQFPPFFGFDFMVGFLVVVLVGDGVVLSWVVSIVVVSV